MMELIGRARSNRRMTQRWSEARIYRTPDGYRLEKIARSNVPSETDRVETITASTAEGFVAGCWIDQLDSVSGQTIRVIPKYIRRALDAAAEQDSALAEVVATVRSTP